MNVTDVRAPIENELDRWLTTERIAGSDLGALMFETGWNNEETLDLYEAALTTFGNGCCFFLASAVAKATGCSIAGFWRKSGDERLVHAAIFDPSTGDGFDILGRRALAQMRLELIEAVGPIRISTIPSVHVEMDAGELECLTVIAAGLPWMPNAAKGIDRDRWRTLIIEYAKANDRYRR